MPQSTLLPTGGYSHILMEEDYGLNASRVVLCRLQQNYFGNEFGWITPFILVVIKQGYALLLFEGTNSWPQTFGLVHGLITSLKASTASETKNRAGGLAACLYLSATVCCCANSHCRDKLCLCRPRANLPLDFIFFHLSGLSLYTLLSVYRCSSYRPSWPSFWIRKIIVFKGTKEVLDVSNPS